MGAVCQGGSSGESGYASTWCPTGVNASLINVVQDPLKPCCSWDGCKSCALTSAFCAASESACLARRGRVAGVAGRALVTG